MTGPVDTPPTSPAPPPPPPEPFGPVREPERIAALDVLRGFALLGIFMVNMQAFAMPFGDFVNPGVYREGSDLVDVLAWAFVKVGFEYKFISLFSFLFGAGLIIQMTRAEQRRRSFVPVYLRRLAILAIIGLVHGFLLWYGDILFVYSCVGFVLLLCRRFWSKAMLVIAGLIIVFYTLLPLIIVTVSLAAKSFLAPFGIGLEPPDEAPEAVAVEEAEAVDGGEVVAETGADEDLTWSEQHPETAERLPWLGAMIDSNFNITSDIWLDAETTAYKEGPFLAAEGFRAFTYLLAIVVAIPGYGWRVLAMFFIGAALMKLQLFSPTRRRLQRVLLIVGFTVGLPLEITQAWLTYFGATHEDLVLMMLGASIHELGSISLCLGLVGGVCVLVESGVLNAVLGAFACVGRLALSNYLFQTIFTTFLMYWWGLGWFGDVSRPAQIGLVCVIYLAQVVLSVLWLRYFTIGPFEWTWRSLTYWKRQPLRRKNQPG